MPHQRVARIGDAAVMFGAAAGVWMGGLGEAAEGGADLRGQKSAPHWQIQNLARFLIVVEIRPNQEGPAFCSRLEAQLDLVLAPFPARHDKALAKGDAAPRLKFVKAERPHHAIGRREKSVPAALAMLDAADHDLIENSQRAVPDDPSLCIRHRALSCMAGFCPQAFTGGRADASMHVQRQTRAGWRSRVGGWKSGKRTTNVGYGPERERQLPGDMERKPTFTGLRPNGVIRPISAGRGRCEGPLRVVSFRTARRRSMSTSSRCALESRQAAVDRRFYFSAIRAQHCERFFLTIVLLIKNLAPETFWQAINRSPVDFGALTWQSAAFDNLLPVAVGNVIGGSVAVATVCWFIYIRMASRGRR